MSAQPSTPKVASRQIVLPMSKAIEMAYKSIRLRLSRSLLVIAAIALATAFLISILVNNAMIAAMRDWITQTQSAPHDIQLQAQRLATLMKSNGVPLSPEEIHNDRIQTLWLLGLALLVAFIGILNAMLMSVTERFREIGTMKCLGALDGFIVRLFLLESLFQGVVGASIGVLAGILLELLSQTVSYESFAWKNVPVHQLLASAVFCFAVGIALAIAGAVYPAWQAARMQPIAAMRVDI
jgi:putative ABC transport system permease protein